MNRRAREGPWHGAVGPFLLGPRARREEQVTARGVPGLAKGGYYGRDGMGEITSSDAFIDR
jgi:hypothetical protein